MKTAHPKRSPNTSFVLLLVLLVGLITTSSIDFSIRSVTASSNSFGTKPEATIPAATSAPEKTIEPRLIEASGNLPMSFEANQGQTDPRVKFLARGNGYSLFLTPSETVLSLNESVARATGRSTSTASLATRRSEKPITAGQPQARPEVLRMKLAGANSSARVIGIEELPGKSNYLIGSDPKKWQTNVAHYAKVKYEAVYPGVDLVYYGNQQQLEYDFIVAPGANPAAIRMRRFVLKRQLWSHPAQLGICIPSMWMAPMNRC